MTLGATEQPIPPWLHSLECGQQNLIGAFFFLVFVCSLNFWFLMATMDLLGEFKVEGAVGGATAELPVAKEEQGESDPVTTDQRKLSVLEREVDELQRCLQDVLSDRQSRVIPPEFSRPSKTFIKPRDIPVLELRQLRGVEGAGRLTVFLSQVESCTTDTDERQQIVQMRVDAPLALFIQNIRTKERKTWKEFKECLTEELTDQSEDRIYDSINDLNYNYEEDPIEFASRLKCKLAMLEIKIQTGEIPKVERLIKNKLLKGMPKASRDRLDLYMDDNVSLKRFLNKLETERVVVSAQQQTHETVRAIEQPVQPTPGAAAFPPTRSQPPRNSRPWVNEGMRRARGDQGRYCPYCRARNHSVAECRRQPRPGSCYDCLRMNCHRGHPRCPGRVNMMRGRMA